MVNFFFFLNYKTSFHEASSPKQFDHILSGQILALMLVASCTHLGHCPLCPPLVASTVGKIEPLKAVILCKVLLAGLEIQYFS